MTIGITETYDPCWVPDWEKRLKDVNVIITKQLSDDMISKLVEHKDNCILHLTCTGFGGSKYEPNVPKLDWTYGQFKKFVSSGFPISQVVLRIDPILPFSSNHLKYVEFVLHAFSSCTVRYDKKLRCRVSMVDLYPHVIERFSEANIRLPWTSFHAPRTAFEQVNRLLRKYEQHYEFESCAESGFDQTLVKQTGCATVKDIELLGKNTSEFTKQLNGTRKGCLCLSKTNILGVTPGRCPHQCIYCYWKDTPSKELNVCTTLF